MWLERAEIAYVLSDSRLDRSEPQGAQHWRLLGEAGGQLSGNMVSGNTSTDYST